MKIFTLVVAHLAQQLLTDAYENDATCFDELMDSIGPSPGGSFQSVQLKITQNYIYERQFFGQQLPTEEYEVKTDTITINQGDITKLDYDGVISQGDKFEPRELFVHFDGERVVAATGHYFDSTISSPSGYYHDEGWMDCSQWVFNITTGDERNQTFSEYRLSLSDPYMFDFKRDRINIVVV